MENFNSYDNYKKNNNPKTRKNDKNIKHIKTTTNAKRKEIETKNILSNKLRNKQKKEKIKEQKKIYNLIRKEKRAENIKKLKEDFSNIFKKMFVGLILFIVIIEVLFLVNAQTRLDKIQFDINDLSSQIEKNNNSIKELNSKKESSYKSETIENFAKYKLGMVYPTKEQTVYIYLE